MPAPLPAIPAGWSRSRRTDLKHTVWALSCPYCGELLNVAVELAESRSGDIYRVPRCDCGQRVWDASPAAVAAFFAELEARGKEAERQV